MVKRILSVTLAAAVSLGGCTASDVPGCSDAEPLALLNKLTAETYRTMRRNPAEHELRIDLIRTRETSSQTGAHQCAATLFMHNPKNGKAVQIPFTYRVEKLDEANRLTHVESRDLQGGIQNTLFNGRLDDRIEVGPSRGFRAVN